MNYSVNAHQPELRTNATRTSGSAGTTASAGTRRSGSHGTRKSGHRVETEGLDESPEGVKTPGGTKKKKKYNTQGSEGSLGEEQLVPRTATMKILVIITSGATS